MAPGDGMARLDRWATYTTSVRPVRPCSKRTAASSARRAGGEPSYPTTRCKNPVGGVAVVTVVNISSGAGAVAADPGSAAFAAPRSSAPGTLGLTETRLAEGAGMRRAGRQAADTSRIADTHPPGHT